MRDKKTYEFTTVCPFCNAQHPAATGMDTDTGPIDGDVTLCIKCGEWCVFEGDHLVIPDDQTYESIAHNPQCGKVREAWLMMRARAQ